MSTQAAKKKTRLQPVEKKVTLRPQDIPEAEKIASALNILPATARILAARGFRADERLDSFLAPTLRSGLPSPDQLKNLQEACQLIEKVAQKDGLIVICCDFDVDGLSAGSLLYAFLRDAGISSQVLVPDRFRHGYGLHEALVHEAVRLGAELLITVDYGTSNTKQLQMAKELGLKTIVVDHHLIADSAPPVDVFINPHQQGCGLAEEELCAAGLVWYLILGLRRALPRAEQLNPKDYLDLACLGTICDMVPLQGANRVLAKRGLEQLERSSRPGIIALREAVGAKNSLNGYHVSFGMGPRINAAGRLKHGSLVIELLTTKDQKVATKIAAQLNRLNAERQSVEHSVKEKALSSIESLPKLPAALVAWDEEFHTGVIGIVAQRLVETFYRPAAVLGIDEDGVWKGSVRGIKGFHVANALQAAGQHLEKYGGHEGAGGFSVKAENLAAFQKAFTKVCEKALADLDTQPAARCDTEIELSDISEQLLSELKRFQPCGMGNPGPLLMIRGLRVERVSTIKGAHLRAILTDEKERITGLFWRKPSHPALVAGATVNIACKPDANEYNGNRQLQVNLVAVESAGS